MPKYTQQLPIKMAKKLLKEDFIVVIKNIQNIL